ncbi:MAG: biotin transporter BioY [Ruminococcus sp.]|nr:biotin transporter BioY [Ruminococcus sp.]
MKKSQSNILDMVLCALFAAVCCVVSPITIPIGAVPIAFGILAVVFTAIILGPVKGLISVAVYLGIGLFLPLFSNGQNGFSAYPSHTGGYIWSYLLVVLVVGALSKINFNNRVVEIVANTVFCFVGVLICYTCGTAQFMLVTGYDLNSSLTACVYPFLIFDVAKCVIAGVVAPLLKSAIVKSGKLKKA